jgi:hypothetical protein
VTAQIRAGTRLIEVEKTRRSFDVAERCLRDVERSKRDTTPLQRGEQRLLPFGMLVKNDQISRQEYSS